MQNGAASQAAPQETALETPPAAPAAGESMPVRARRAWPREAVFAALRWADFVLLSLAFWGASALSVDAPLWRLSVAEAAPWIAAPFLFVWALNSAGAYRFRPVERARAHAGVVAGAALVAIAAAALIAIPGRTGAATVAAAGVMITALLIPLHEAWRRLVRDWVRQGRFAHNVVIVGATPNAERLIESNARRGEINVMAVFDDRVKSGRAPEKIGGAPVLGSVEDLLSWPDLPRADRVLITVTSLAAERTQMLIEQLRPLPNKIVLFLDLDSFRAEATDLASIADLPVAYVSGQPDRLSHLAVKRVEDVVLATLALVALGPLMALIALAVKLDSRGPVLFRQDRHGFNNRIIKVLKFRTMRAEVSGGPTVQVVENDPRVTRLGRLLRRTSLDELPQLFNVLGGEMSMVGPRPHATDMKTGEVESARLVADYAHRCRTKPGITGWAQIHGSRGPVHTAEEVETRVRYDVDYIQRQSLWLDLWIILRTVPCFLGDAMNTR